MKTYRQKLSKWIDNKIDSNVTDEVINILEEVKLKIKEMEKEEMLKFGIKCQLDFIKSDGVRAVDDLWEETYGGNK